MGFNHSTRTMNPQQRAVVDKKIAANKALEESLKQNSNNKSVNSEINFHYLENPLKLKSLLNIFYTNHCDNYKIPDEILQFLNDFYKSTTDTSVFCAKQGFDSTNLDEDIIKHIKYKHLFNK